MTVKITEAQRERATKDINEAKIKLVQAIEKLGRTLEIAKTEEGWETFLEEDANRVQYWEKYIAKLTTILEKGEIEVA